jgi:hypothetical protein
MTAPSNVDSAGVRDLMALWLSAARARLADPGSLDPKTLNRLGELIMSAAVWVSEQERAAALAARIARMGPGR